MARIADRMTRCAPRKRLLSEADGDLQRLLIRHTRPVRPSLCPELQLHLAEDMGDLWEAMEQELGIDRMPPPFWSVAWPGGLALARYLLEHPALVQQRTVVDVGAGSGLCALAAARAGATRVVANDIDPLARAAIAQNAKLNGMQLEIDGTDLLGAAMPPGTLILAGDLWYERQVAERITPWLARLARGGCHVLLGDKRRRNFPRRGLQCLARYRVETSTSREEGELTEAGVYVFESAPHYGGAA